MDIKNRRQYDFIYRVAHLISQNKKVVFFVADDNFIGKSCVEFKEYIEKLDKVKSELSIDEFEKIEKILENHKKIKELLKENNELLNKIQDN